MKKQYIDKSNLIAEIKEKIKKYATIDVGNCKELEAIYGAKCKALTEILFFLDTLDVLTLDNIKEMENQAFIHGIEVERNENIFKDNKEIKI